MNHPALVVLGSYNRDVSLLLKRFPEPGETCLALNRTEAHGGKGSNQAIQAALCGAAVTMIACVGDDQPGRAAMAFWQEHSIDVSGTQIVAGASTGVAVILVNNAGENMIAVDSGANSLLSPDIIESRQQLLARSTAVIAQLETPLQTVRQAFEIARGLRVSTFLNAAPAAIDLDEGLLEYVDILIVNEREACALAGTSATDDIRAAVSPLLARVAKAVVITRGAGGAMLFRHSYPPLFREALPVKVLDTTGAGDAFTGAFAARWVETCDPEEALSYAVVAGSLACRTRGAVTSFPDAKAIDAALHRAPHQDQTSATHIKE
jgi:ribokinase